MSDRKLTKVVAGLFIAAMIMGPGPGLRLINPDPSDPDAVYTFLGIPTVYAWGLFWYLIQLVAILVAYRRLWRE
ncbi:MAG: hypothetical protein CME21_10110 [Gemmatimonadetes bacterium]|jgi:hypothetical protein|nr:hypothetical protein [Gemmatimonadota bacterium]HCK10691.1 hypothetical protein [Candidatus Latescibacterota bacterium]